MQIIMELKDTHGKAVEIGKRVALKVHRVGGTYGNWWRQTNKHHFEYFWLAGTFEKQKGDNWSTPVIVRFIPDALCLEALRQPMGKEQEPQEVDYLNVPLLPEYLDSEDVPISGTFRKD